MNFNKIHNLTDENKIIQLVMDNLDFFKLNKDEIMAMDDERRNFFIVGEYYAFLTSHVGDLASKYLYKGQNSKRDWFDHRHHLLCPEREFLDFNMISGDNVIMVMPYKAKVLNLCSGDGWYDYYFFRKRALEIDCVDVNEEVYKQAKRLHFAKNINYILHDVLTYSPKENYYDIVLIRGSIEHFSRDNQQLIFKKACEALKTGGWFCGDTPENEKAKDLLLKQHENEWESEEEMKNELKEVFDNVETMRLRSENRTTLFWRCQK